MKNVLAKFVSTPRGEWDEKQSYKALDIVSRNGNGYLALKDVQGIPPGDDKVNWMLLARRGDQGPVYVPAVSKDGLLSFTNNGDLENPKPVNIMGKRGLEGKAATVKVGKVVTVEPGEAAGVSNVGTDEAAILDFRLPEGKDGEPGVDGIDGQDGKDGRSGTIQIGSVVTGLPGSRVEIKNSGTAEDAILNIVIPAGHDGMDGSAATVRVGNVITAVPGTPASVNNSGTDTDSVLNFVIPKGETGEPGKDGRSVNILAELDGVSELPPAGSVGDGYLIDGYLYVWNEAAQGYVNVGRIQGPEGKRGYAATVRVGKVETAVPGTQPIVNNSGTDTDAVLNFVIPKGEKGDTGENAAIQVGYVAAVAPDAEAKVTNGGTATKVVLNFEIPRGYPGVDGQSGKDGVDGKDGKAASIQIGTITKLASGNSPTVNNSGNKTAVVLDFGIPEGERGKAGKPLVVDGYVEMLPPRPVPEDRYIIRPDVTDLYAGIYYLNCGRSSGKGFRIVGDVEAVCPAPDYADMCCYADLGKGDVITGWIPVERVTSVVVVWGTSGSGVSKTVEQYNEANVLLETDTTTNERKQYLLREGVTKLRIRVNQKQGGRFSFVKVFKLNGQAVHNRIYRWMGSGWVTEPVRNGLPVYVKGKEFYLRQRGNAFRKIEEYSIPRLDIVGGEHNMEELIRLKERVAPDNYMLRFYCRRRRCKRKNDGTYYRMSKYCECRYARKHREWPNGGGHLRWPQPVLRHNSRQYIVSKRPFDRLELSWKDLFDRVFVSELNIYGKGPADNFWPDTGLKCRHLTNKDFSSYADFGICLAKRINGKLVNGEMTYLRLVTSNYRTKGVYIRILK